MEDIICHITRQTYVPHILIIHRTFKSLKFMAWLDSAHTHTNTHKILGRKNLSFSDIHRICKTYWTKDKFQIYLNLDEQVKVS